MNNLIAALLAGACLTIPAAASAQTQLLRGTVRSNSGLTGFRLVFDPEPEQAECCPHDLLSPRELEVARLVGLGRQTKQVAYQLSLSEHTIENHLRRIYGKLGIHSRAALAHLMS